MKSVEEVFYDLCKRVDSPVSLGLWLRFRMAPRELAEATIDPLDYNDPVSFGDDYACLSFLRKYKGLGTGIDLRREALLGFGKSEERCREFNERLWPVATTGRLARTEPAILQRAREIIAAVWGRPSLSQLVGHCGWGPGATSSLKGGRATREDKMSQYPVSITRSAAPYFRVAIREDILWLRHLLKQDVVGPVSLLDCCFSFTEESRVLTVPKDARKDRTIAAEPTGNIYIQKGIGSYIRSRLRYNGIDLDSQAHNQHLASQALKEGLATLDLSAASDTVTIGVVKLLCPPDMFAILNRTRTASYQLNGVKARFHKFSSMGNGFTFELETLIFYAVSRAVKERRDSVKPIGVYGDDIIVGQDIVQEVVVFLEDLGFTVNKEKSFVSGVFFESCGKHYFRGVDVTPPYQKEIVDSDLEYIRMANRLFDWIQADAFGGLGRRRRFGRLHASIIQSMPHHLRKAGVFGYPWMKGDGFFRVYNPDVHFDLRYGYRLRYLKPKPARKRLGDGGFYADRVRSSFLGLPSDAPDRRSPFGGVRDSEPTRGLLDIRPRSKEKEYKVKTRWVPTWERYC
jgi:hypothetical protein